LSQPLSIAHFGKLRARNRRVEGLLRGGLTVSSIGLGIFYVGGLLFLLVRGVGRVVAFTTFPTPLSGISNELMMRVAVAAVLGSIAGACAEWLARPLLVRAFPRIHLHGGTIAAILGAIVFAVFFHDHLPRFLISMPSETRAGGGVGPEMFNTIYFAVLSTIVVAPVGIGAALYLAKFSGSQRFASSVRIALDTLASLPSIIYGLFGFLIFVVQMRAGYSLLAGACVLALLNLPLVVGVAEESIRAVPRELEDASLALGATVVQTVFRVSVPYAWPGILSVLVLSVGRVFAESAPLIMTAGTTVSRSTAYSLDPMRGGETLAVHLWYVNSAGLAPDKAEISAATAALLVILVAVTNITAAKLARFGGAKGGTRARKIVGG
jgi:phosphate transport system permease protein